MTLEDLQTLYPNAYIKITNPFTPQEDDNYTVLNRTVDENGIVKIDVLKGWQPWMQKDRPVFLPVGLFRSELLAAATAIIIERIAAAVTAAAYQH